MSNQDPLLSEAQALAMPWLDSPFFAAMLEKMELDTESMRLVRDFSQNGYVIFDPKIPNAWLDAAREEVRDCYDGISSAFYSDDKRVQDAWVFRDHVRKIANAPRVLEVLEMLYRRKPFPFQTLNFRRGSEQKTHSDMAYFDSIPHGYMCGVWVALEDVDETNGPLHYYPGSQKLPTFNIHNLGLVASSAADPLHNVARYEQFVEALMPATGLQRQELRIEKGQALIWAANLYHGGCPIVDRGRTRHTQVTHYYFDGCLYYTPLASDPGIGRIMPRKIYHAADGSIVPQYYNGKLIANPGEWPPRLADEIEEVAASPALPEQPKRKFELLRRAFAALRA
ncbi:MAG TPA: phytanoyl-CoA dioxygenase family protein [Thermoanaerobaculia bacterium]|nr:phytanoyl-CoA dioxygenase family protein [Thermoanaerobaculia bacterium]